MYLMGTTGTTASGIPTALLFGGSVAAATAVAEVSKNYIIPKSMTGGVVQMVAEPSLEGVVTVVANRLLLGADSDMNAAVRMFLIGAGSNVGSDYVSKNIVGPMVRKFY